MTDRNAHFEFRPRRVVDRMEEEEEEKKKKINTRMTKLGHVICILCKYIHAMREKFTYARVPRRVHVPAPMVKEIVYLLCIFNDNFSSPTWPPRNFMPVAYIQS